MDMEQKSQSCRHCSWWRGSGMWSGYYCIFLYSFIHIVFDTAGHGRHSCYGALSAPKEEVLDSVGGLLCDIQCNRWGCERTYELFSVETIRMIPATTVSHQHMLLQAASIHKMTICGEQEIRPAVVAFADNMIFEGKNYQMILHHDYSI